MDPHQYRELLDACRPGSDDLAQPDMAVARAALEENPALRRQAARMEQFDRAVASAMHDVSVPEGLKERLLAKLAKAAVDAPAAVVSENSVLSAHAAGGRRRRLLLATMGTLAALAACAAVAVAIRWNTAGEDWQPAAVAGAAAPSFDEYALRADGWSAGVAPAYPLGQFLVANRQLLHRSVDVAGCSGAAYRVKSRQGVLGVLFVLNPRASLKGFPARPPGTPQVDTGGRVAVCWKEQNLLYVLVYEGGAKDYHGFLRQTGPTALAGAPRLL